MISLIYEKIILGDRVPLKLTGTDRQAGGQMDRWTDGRTDGRTNGRTDGWTNLCTGRLRLLKESITIEENIRKMLGFEST